MVLDMNLILWCHTHRYGQDNGICQTEKDPNTLEPEDLAEALGLDFEPDREETLEWVSLKPEQVVTI